MPTANDGEQLSSLITFKFSAKITHTPGILIPFDFHPDKGSDQVVPRWKSPDVMVDCEFGLSPPNPPLYVWHESQEECRDQSECPITFDKHLPTLGKLTLCGLIVVQNLPISGKVD